MISTQITTKFPQQKTSTDNIPYPAINPIDSHSHSKGRAGYKQESTLPVMVAVTVELRQCACGCGKRFPAINPAKRYLDRNHKQKAYKARKQPKTERYCKHCGSHDMPSRRDAKYCCATCRTMAYRHRRFAMIPALIELGAPSREFAMDVLDKAGAKAVTRTLQSHGLKYSYKRNRWQ